MVLVLAHRVASEVARDRPAAVCAFERAVAAEQLPELVGARRSGPLLGPRSLVACCSRWASGVARRALVRAACGRRSSRGQCALRCVPSWFARRRRVYTTDPNLAGRHEICGHRVSELDRCGEAAGRSCSSGSRWSGSDPRPILGSLPEAIASRPEREAAQRNCRHILCRGRCHRRDGRAAASAADAASGRLRGGLSATARACDCDARAVVALGTDGRRLDRRAGGIVVLGDGVGSARRRRRRHRRRRHGRRLDRRAEGRRRRLGRRRRRPGPRRPWHARRRRRRHRRRRHNSRAAETMAAAPATVGGASWAAHVYGSLYQLN